MGFQTSAPQRNSVIGQVVWNQKKIQNLTTPNIRFYNKDTKEESFLVPPGDRTQAQVVGKLAKVSFGQVESYTDREKNTGEKNLWRMYVTLDGGKNEPLSVLSLDVFDASTKRVNSDSLGLVNSLATLVEAQANGEVDANHPVMIGFYRKADKNDKSKTYPQSIVRLPSGQDAEGYFEFKDSNLFIKSPTLPPRGKPVLDASGNHVEVAGIKAYDYSEAIAWLEDKAGFLTSYFEKNGDQDVTAPQDEAPAADEDGVDLAGVAEAATQQQARQRMAG